MINLVSVIIPFYNAEPYLGECIESVLSQAYQNYEILAVDDGSVDKSADIVRNFASNDARVRLLSHSEGRNRGVSESRRLGLDKASGEFVAFLDSDDCMNEMKLEKQVELMQSHEECVLSHTAISLIQTDIDHGYNSCDQWFNSFPVIGPYQHRELDGYLNFNQICNSTVMIRTEVAKKVLCGFPQAYQTEDWTWWNLIASEGAFLFFPEVLTRYRVHEASATANVVGSNVKRHYARLEMLLSTIAYMEVGGDFSTLNEKVWKEIIDIIYLYKKDFQLQEAIIEGESDWEKAFLQLENRKLKKQIMVYEHSKALMLSRAVGRIVKHLGIK